MNERSSTRVCTSRRLVVEDGLDSMLQHEKLHCCLVYCAVQHSIVQESVVLRHSKNRARYDTSIYHFFGDFFHVTDRLFLRCLDVFSTLHCRTNSLHIALQPSADLLNNRAPTHALHNPRSYYCCCTSIVVVGIVDRIRLPP